MIRTTVIGSYPLPGWLEHAAAHLDAFGPDDVAELQDDAVIAAVHDQVAAGLDVITDGEQTRLDFNLSFYGYLEGIELEGAPAAALRPARPRPARPAPRHRRAARRRAASASSPSSSGCGASRPAGPRLKASVPGPYTLARTARSRTRDYPDRWALTEALLPIVRAELGRAGRRRLRGDRRRRAVDELLRAPRGSRALRRHLQPHGRARRRPHAALDAPLLRQLQGPRRRAAALRADVPRVPRHHASTRSTSRWRAASSPSSRSSRRSRSASDAAVGIVDVKSYWIEPPEEVAARVRHFLRLAPAERLVFSPDCGLSPDRALGRAAEAREPGRGRATWCDDEL